MTEQLRAIDLRFGLGRIGKAPPAILDRVLTIIRDNLLARPGEAGRATT
jgi:hypothetical protein